MALVLADHKMPDMTGSELCERMRQDERLVHTPVVMLTARGFELDRARLKEELGISEVFIKPCKLGKLIETIRKLLATCPTNS